jgi:hypothetical protein
LVTGTSTGSSGRERFTLSTAAVQPGLGGRCPEGRLVQLWRACCDNHAIEVVFLDGIDDHLLTRSGAEVGIVGRHGRPGDISRKLDHLLHLDVASDVLAAMAHEDSDFRHQNHSSESK